MRALPLAAAVVALSASAPASASETATVTGRVTDTSGGVVAGAAVTAHNVDTGLSRSAVTEADGTYRIPVLPPGRYELNAQLAGFGGARRARTAIDVPRDARMRSIQVTTQIDF